MTMKPLLEITTVPISIEYKVNAAQYERKNATAELEISREKGGLSIKSRPIQVDIDTFEARNSITPTPFRSMDQAAQKGKQYAYEATAKFAEEGDMMVNLQLNQDPITEIASQAGMKSTEFNIAFLPDVPADINWIPGEMNIRYEMDKLNFDWKQNKNSLQFTPASIEFQVLSRPQVILKYVGEPIYVPPSSSPNYEPVDVMA